MRRQDKYPDTEYFHYENVNPKNRFTGDCVYRAIAKAMGWTWTKTVKALTDQALETGYCPNSVENYSRFLQAYGFEKHPQPRHDDRTKYTLREFINEHKTGTYVVNMPGHTTVVVDGKNIDIWDCSRSRSKIGNFWEVQ